MADIMTREDRDKSGRFCHGNTTQMIHLSMNCPMYKIIHLVSSESMAQLKRPHMMCKDLLKLSKIISTKRNCSPLLHFDRPSSIYCSIIFQNIYTYINRLSSIYCSIISQNIYIDWPRGIYCSIIYQNIYID